MNIIRRDKYVKDLIIRRNNGLIKVITGMRRCGKSVILNSLFYEALLEQGLKQSNIIRFAFDSAKDLESIGEDYLEISSSNRKVDAKKFIKYVDGLISNGEPYVLLLDEIQMLEAFESVLNGLLRNMNLDIYVTGSNSKFLSKDIITEFRGRGDVLHVLPLSFSEYYSSVGGDKYEAFDNYLLYGGLPFVATLDTDEQKVNYLKRLFEETYVKDIIDRNNIKKTVEMENLLDILASAVGSLTNPSRIQNTFVSKINSKITVDTIIDYINYLQDAYLISEVKRYDVKGRQYIGSPQKYYYEDIGLRNARLSFRQLEENHLMENIIYNELRYRGYSVDVGIVEKRFIDDKMVAKKALLEVDFIANLGSQRYYVQSAFEMNSDEKEKQEKESLRKVKDFFKKIVIVKDNIKVRRDNEGIVTIGMIEFLLNPNSLEL
ncbi:MAG: ATP-binding protein [Sphaerochaetaceae bacterium]|nr:ATP-binding protein [Sphaerochaetaceae bacterium]